VLPKDFGTGIKELTPSFYGLRFLTVSQEGDMIEKIDAFLLDAFLCCPPDWVAFQEDANH